VILLHLQYTQQQQKYFMAQSKLEAQIKAHWSKVMFAVAAALITIITQTGDAVATRISDLVFKNEMQNAMFETCKKEDSAIKAIHAADISRITESIIEIKQSNLEIKASYIEIGKSNSDLEKKIDIQSAMIDGYFKGMNHSISKTDSTKPCGDKLTAYRE
jgi:hypothetical protein